MSKYKGLFLSESQERLQTLDQSILALEKTPENLSLVDDLFRAFHSLKGMASSMGFTAMASLAHALEDLLESLRERRKAVPASWIDTLLAGRDLLETFVKAVERDEPLEPQDTPMRELISQVKALTQPPASPDFSAAVRDEDPAKPATPSAISPALRITFSEKCAIPAARGFLVYKRLLDKFPAMRSRPALEDIKRGAFERTIEFEIPGEFSEKEVRDVLATINDIGQIEFVKAAEADKSNATPGFDEFIRPPTVLAAPVVSAPSGKIRVSTDFLDHLINGMGELLISGFQIQNLLKPSKVSMELNSSVRQQMKALRELYEKVLTVRMTPLDAIAEKLPRVVRDLARKTGKKINLEMSGTEILMDRAILEELDAPLLHLVRNAVDHGIETPEERQRLGKTERATLTLKATLDQGLMVLEISDDGQGMDVERLKESAQRKGLISAAQAAALSRQEALMLICLPGFSTAKEVTEISGRGVGMDAVRRVVESYDGMLEIQSSPGHGSRFLLRLPLTVSIVKVLLFSIAEQTLALPITRIHRTLEVPSVQVHQQHAYESFFLESEEIPLIRMGEVLGFNKRQRARGGVLTRASPSASIPVVMVGQHGRHYGLQVDRFLGQQDVVLKPVSAALKEVPWISGATILGNGRPAFVLDVNRILQNL